jgi:hypothetical protein
MAEYWMLVSFRLTCEINIHKEEKKPFIAYACVSASLQIVKFMHVSASRIYMYLYYAKVWHISFRETGFTGLTR